MSWALIALLTLLCVVFADVVFKGRTLLTSPYAGSVTGVQPLYGYPGRPPRFNAYVLDPGASAWQYEPLTAKASQVYRNGGIPLWNANQGLGAPLAANMHSSVFYLPSLLLYVAPSPSMWDAYLLARLLAAGLLTFAFARCIEVGFVGALGAGLAFMLSGYLLLWVNSSWLNVDILVPTLLLGIEKVLTSDRRAWTFFLALVVSLAFLGGMPESTFVVGLLGLAYAGFRMIALMPATESRRFLIGRAARVLTAGACGVGLSAFLLFPFVEYVYNAYHLHTAGSTNGLVHRPSPHVFTLLVPYIEGKPLRVKEPPLFYAGIVAPLLGGIATVVRGDHRRKFTWFFVAVALLALAKTYGIGINAVGSLPVFNLVNYWKHLGVVVCFAVAMLAGLGLHGLSGGWVERRHAIVVTLVGQVLAVALLLVFWSAFGIRAEPDHLVIVLGTAAALSVGIQGAIVCLSRSPSRLRGVGVACLLLMVVELVYLAPRPPRPFRHAADTTPPAVGFIQQDRPEYRVFAQEGILYPNTASYFNLNDVRSLDAMYPSRYFQYVREFISPAISDRFIGHPWPGASSETATRCLANPWFDLVGVKYVLTSAWRALFACDDGGSLLTTIVGNGDARVGGRRDGFVINGVGKTVLLQDAPSQTRFELRPDRHTPKLLFSLALDPRAWDPSKGDGVRFAVLVRSDGREELAFSRWVDPKNDPRDRRWIDGAVDLTRYEGRRIEVVLATESGASKVWDLAGWGDLRLGDGRAEIREAPQYVPVWMARADRDFTVYQNTRAFPRAFLVRAVEVVDNSAEALARMKRPEFDPRRSVVIEAPATDVMLTSLASASASPIVPVEFIEYRDSRVRLKVETDTPALLVLTDVFYPGWNALVDGREAPIYPADYAFRGVTVPAGQNVVEFVYRPKSFQFGVAVSSASALLLTAVLVISGRHSKVGGDPERA